MTKWALRTDAEPTGRAGWRPPGGTATGAASLSRLSVGRGSYDECAQIGLSRARDTPFLHMGRTPAGGPQLCSFSHTNPKPGR
jgi:hypothetical protein